MFLLRRPVLLTMGLAMALAGPYVCVESGSEGSLRKRWNELVNQHEPAEAHGSTAEAPFPAELPPVGAAFTSIANAALTNAASVAAIEQAFRFDVTPNWVSSRWPRVSTVVGETDQLGMRVAYVSGTQADDVAGSLTYYFDPHHKLQRITFYGTTGDANRLLMTVVTPNGLVSRPTTGAAHCIAGDPEKPTSEVIVRHLPVVDARAPVRMEVAIDLRRSDVQGWGKWQLHDRQPRLPQRSY